MPGRIERERIQPFTYHEQPDRKLEPREIYLGAILWMPRGIAGSVPNIHVDKLDHPIIVIGGVNEDKTSLAPGDSADDQECIDVVIVRSFNHTSIEIHFADSKENRLEYIPLDCSPQRPHPDHGTLLKTVVVTGRPSMVYQQSYASLEPFKIPRKCLLRLRDGTIRLERGSLRVLLRSIRIRYPGIKIGDGVGEETDGVLLAGTSRRALRIMSRREELMRQQSSRVGVVGAGGTAVAGSSQLLLSAAAVTSSPRDLDLYLNLNEQRTAGIISISPAVPAVRLPPPPPPQATSSSSGPRQTTRPVTTQPPSRPQPAQPIAPALPPASRPQQPPTYASVLQSGRTARISTPTSNAAPALAATRQPAAIHSQPTTSRYSTAPTTTTRPQAPTSTRLTTTTTNPLQRTTLEHTPYNSSPLLESGQYNNYRSTRSTTPAAPQRTGILVDIDEDKDGGDSADIGVKDVLLTIFNLTCLAGLGWWIWGKFGSR
ncbi:hypothetical protein DFH27DRAFT_81690 [Peziza echinospora]|nr:hypothetical protein DFH27DRAFT_81690 [Peziza echinospora]